MKAISIQQPWAWLIACGLKDVENRRWPTAVRGRVLIHAGQKFDLDGYEWILLNHQILGLIPNQIPEMKHYQKGGVIGEMEIVDCVRSSQSPWFGGPFGFVIKNAKPLPFMACSGQLKFFEVRYEMQAAAKPEPATKPEPNIFAFVRSQKACSFSKEGQLYKVITIGIDGHVFHEFEAMTMDEAKAGSGASTAVLDDLFGEHFPKAGGGWRIKWVNAPGAHDGVKQALAALRKAQKAGQEAESAPGQPADQGQEQAEATNQGAQQAQSQEQASSQEPDKSETVKQDQAKDQAKNAGQKKGKKKDGPEVVHLDLPVELDLEQRAKIADEAMVCLRKMAMLEADRKTEADRFKGAIAEQEKSLQELRKQYDGGSKTTVPCTVHRHENNEIYRVVRNDNQKDVEQKDWQPVLGLQAKAEKKPGVPKPDQNAERYIALQDVKTKQEFNVDCWAPDGWLGIPATDIVLDMVFRRTCDKQPVFDDQENAVFKAKDKAERKAELLVVRCIPWALETTMPEAGK